MTTEEADFSGQAIMKQLEPINDLIKAHGSLRVAYAIVNICKWLPDIVELPRPLLSLDETVIQQIKDALKVCELI